MILLRSYISHDPLQKIYPNLARKHKNKFHENKIKLKWLNNLKINSSADNFKEAYVNY